MNTNLFDFIKSAAEYSQETSDVVQLAYGIVNDMTQAQQKCASLVPETVARMESLTRANGQPFVPDGFTKQASAILSDHAKTLTMLNHVLSEYGQLKEAFDRLTPPIGQMGKTASTQKNLRVDGHESEAWRRGRERLLALS